MNKSTCTSVVCSRFHIVTVVMSAKLTPYAFGKHKVLDFTVPAHGLIGSYLNIRSIFRMYCCQRQKLASLKKAGYAHDAVELCVQCGSSAHCPHSTLSWALARSV